jgi:CheY-like chemotaxis protein/HPt (histidine-containing phosphotransfer) domain-containing protein
MADDARQAGVAVTCVVEAQVPGWLLGDAGRLTQILAHLLVNAIQRAAPGSVAIRVSKEGGGEIRFEVAEFGRAMTPETESQFFDQPIGDSTLRRLIETIGGESGFSSGCWFTAMFAEAAHAQSGTESSRGDGLLGKRVLVAVPGRSVREEVKSQLASCGCEIEEASGVGALADRLRNPNSRPRELVDLVIADLEELGIDAHGLAAALGRGVAVRMPPTVSLVNGDAPAPKTAAPEFALAAVVKKPVQKDALEAAISAALGIHRPSDAESPRCRPSETILVVDDSEVNRIALEAILNGLGFHVDSAANGWIALRLLRDREYALVFTDCEMPKIDGYELTRIIRDPATEKVNHRIPVIAVTALSSQFIRDKCLETGMDEYICKPVDVQTVEAVLRRWLPKGLPKALPKASPKVSPKASPADAPSPRLVPAIEPPAPSHFDRDGLVRRMLGNEDLARTVAGAFLEDTMSLQLPALAAAVRNADAPAARMAAHTIRGGASNVGGNELSGLARQMEVLAAAGSLGTANELLAKVRESFETLKESIRDFRKVR